MPLRQGNDRKTISKNIAEFHQGQTYAATKARYGKAAADRQAVAVAMAVAKRARKSLAAR